MLTELEKLAEDMGITITTHHNGEKGRWYPAERIISIRSGLHPVQRLCTLAHELGHAHHGHIPGATGLGYVRQEREADEWAAVQLISEVDYQLAEELCDGHVGGIASELGVTCRMVKVWQGVYWSEKSRAKTAHYHAN